MRALALAKFATDCHFPTTRRLIARRLAEHPKAVEELLARAKGDESLQDILDGLAAGFAGRHKVKVPSRWEGVQLRVAASESEKLHERVRDLSVLFGDGRALDEVKRIALDGKAEMASRKAALQMLIDNKPDDVREVCEKLLVVRSLNTVAVRGLAAFDDPALGEKLAKNYRSFTPQERPAVIETLVSRPSFAKALLSEMAAGKTDRALTLQTAKDRLTLADIDELQASSLSLMPEGQLQPLTDAEIRDLVGYLMHPTQVPLP